MSALNIYWNGKEVQSWDCITMKVCVCLDAHVSVCTSVSVEHGHIQVCSTGVDEVLFQSLTSQQIFSNGGKDERKSHTDTYKCSRTNTHTGWYILRIRDISHMRQSLNHEVIHVHFESTLVLLYIHYSTLLHPIFFIFTPLTHKLRNVFLTESPWSN